MSDLEEIRQAIIANNENDEKLQKELEELNAELLTLYNETDDEKFKLKVELVFAQNKNRAYESMVMKRNKLLNKMIEYIDISEQAQKLTSLQSQLRKN